MPDPGWKDDLLYRAMLHDKPRVIDERPAPEAPCECGQQVLVSIGEWESVMGANRSLYYQTVRLETGIWWRNRLIFVLGVAVVVLMVCR